MLYVRLHQRNGGSGVTGSRRQAQQHQSRHTSSSSSASSSHHSFRNVDTQMANLIMNEIMDHGPRVGFDDIGLCLVENIFFQFYVSQTRGHPYKLYKSFSRTNTRMSF